MRRLEEHISSAELASLLKSLEALDCGGPDGRQLAQHLRQCDECRELAEMHWRLKDLRGSSESESTIHCQDAAVWLDWAEGNRPDYGPTLLKHASQCAKCSGLLKEVTELAQESQIELDATKLASASVDWQLRVAKEMASSQGVSAAGRVPSKVVPSSRRWFWALVPVAALILISAWLVGTKTEKDREPSNEHLLALAYNKQRTLALRIPGGDPAPMASGTRGATGLEPPEELLELQLRVRQHLDQNNNDPYWHQVRGEVELLQGKGFAARNDFETAREANAALPNLASDLASASFVIGESGGPSEAYGVALDLLDSEITLHPNDSMLLYNRALCRIRVGKREKAVEDLKKALENEPTDEWRRAIQAEIDRISAHSVLGAPFTQKGLGLAGDAYETSLQEAIEQLLPHWGDSQQTRDRLIQIANVGTNHQDLWLQDWIAAARSARSIRGDTALANAVHMGTVGRAGDSLAQAKEAMLLYKRANNRPGELRAELAVVYALQRLDRARECLESSASLERDLGNKQYSWLRAQLTLEQADCEGLSGDFNKAQRNFEKSLALSDHAGLSQLHLRAIGSLALLLDIIGKPLAAWDLNTEGIKFCAQVKCPPIRHYQLLYNSASFAEELDLSHLAADEMLEAVRVAAQTGDITTHAYAVETLAVMQGRSGDYDASARSFAEAAKIIHSSRNSPIPVLYQAEWDTDRAEILLQKGNKDDALNVLRGNGAGMDRSDYQEGRLRYLEELAAIQLAKGNISDGLSSAWRAVALAEKSLPEIHDPRARELWERENVFAYTQLVKGYLQSGHAAEALDAWERFRRVPYERFHEPLGRSTPEKEGMLQGTQPDPRVLVIARIERNYVLWLVAVHPLRVIMMATVADGSRIRMLATTLYHLCSDRNSSIQDIRTVGDQIYKILLAPFGSELDRHVDLWLDLDPSLDVLPVSAIPTPSGQWLGASSDLAVAPRLWTLTFHDTLAPQPLTASAKIVVVDGFGQRPAQRTGYSESSEIAGLFVHPELIVGDSTSAVELKKYLIAANVFHFSGHALSESGSEAILGNHGNFLTADMVSSLRLKHCALAVLAACNTTATGPDRFAEIPDLRNAMLRAGARTVVASTWNVDDHSTHALMLSFYREILKGKTPEESLRVAKESIQAIPSWQHPFYWASFESFTN